jgi:hypothetical protein
MVEPAGSRMQSGVLTLTETVLPVLADGEQRSRFRLRGESDLIQWTGEKSQGGGHRSGAKVCPFAPLCVSLQYAFHHEENTWS